MSGNKGTILFVHGMCHGSWCWEEAFIPFFERKGYQCQTLTLEGHVAGNKQSISHVRLADFDRNIGEAVSSMNEPPFLIGHSMGGMVVQRYLRTEKCRKVVLMASVPLKERLQLV